MIATLLVILAVETTVAQPSSNQDTQQHVIQLMDSSEPKTVVDSPHCDASEFTCDNGDCIPSNWKCHNENDCKDHSDESWSHCSSILIKNDNCAADEYQCNDGTCIPILWMCDVVDDCEKGEDEVNCTSIDPECDDCSTNSNVADDVIIFNFPNAPCFPPGATVRTLNGSITMDTLHLGMEVLSLSLDGQLVYSPVIAFLDKDTKRESKYTTIETEDGTALTLTRSHLIHSITQENDAVLNNPNRLSALPVFASKIKVNDYVYVTSEQLPQLRLSRVVKVTNSKQKGNYAPLTLEGTIIVDGVLASCYAVIDDHRMAHTSFSLLRFLHNSMPSLLKEKIGYTLSSWYPKLLTSIGEILLDEKQVHHSHVKRIFREKA